ncbi:MAG TPA: thiamine-phosphate kinase [Methanothermococcus okinawensis]|uniref:Thiamine-monophosphate kinase n=1 Tax=Methanothermococcus okinawensis TaxID=155863 RepID=A0A832YT61_9EURY|nr:thiamine-phosphate kinase [Methanothermococcus okinawensis]
MNLTELDIIKMIGNNLTYKGNVLKSIGDDCAVFKLEKEYLVITTDMMFKSTHFPDILTPFQIGMRVITANLSDIAAMCAKPLGIVVSMGFNAPKRDFIMELTKGMDHMAREYKCPIVGGDTNNSKELTLCGTAFGMVKNPIFRGGNVGEDIMITYDIGRVYCALEIIKMKNKGIINKRTFESLLEEYPNIIKKLTEPMARINEGIIINEYINSCCDISDGLKKELFYIGNFEIYSKKLLNAIPKDVMEFCHRFNIDPIVAALNSGEEFELLFTTERSKEVIHKLKEECNGRAVGIGKVIEEGHYIDDIELKPGGYIHKW